MLTIRRDGFMKRVALGLAAFAATLSGFAAVESGKGVLAVVSEFSVISNDWQVFILRDGTKVPARIGSLLRPGDQLELPGGSAVKLYLPSDDFISLSGPGIFSIPEAGFFTPVVNFLESLPSLFSDDHRIVGTAATKGIADCDVANDAAQPPRIALPDSGGRLLSGSGKTLLSWVDGCGPFTAELVMDSGVRVHATSPAPSPLRMSNLSLAAGAYILTVHDVRGMRSSYRLDVVDEMPAFPEELDDHGGSVAELARVAWLADEAQGTWLLESLSRLSQLADSGDPLAAALLRGAGLQ